MAQMTPEVSKLLEKALSLSLEEQEGAAIVDVFEKMSEAPERWPEYLHGTQRFVLRRFPFSAIYLNSHDVVDVVAIAHNKRKPGNWERRL